MIKLIHSGNHSRYRKGEGPVRAFRKRAMAEALRTARSARTINVTASLRGDGMVFETRVCGVTRKEFDRLSQQKKNIIRDALRFIVKERLAYNSNPKIASHIVEGGRKGIRRRVQVGKKERCLCCNSSRMITEHHIVPISRTGKNVNENIAVLCRNCHDELEEIIRVKETDHSMPFCYVDYVALFARFFVTKTVA